MHKKRLTIIFSVFSLCMAYLMVISADICFLRGDDYTKSAVSQRVKTIEEKVYRGKFLDRNMVPLVENIVSDGVPVRYGADAVACHLIGYVNGDGEGVSGLERVFEDTVKAKSVGKRKVIESADGRKIDFFGSSIYEGEYLSNNVVLTIDSHIQALSENELKKRKMTGAVVVMDTETCDVLAMASYPQFNQNNVAETINSQNGELINRCLSPYNAGSIFKIVTYSAALEFGRLSQNYNCTGSMDVYSTSFSCHKRDGHGVLNGEEAFAKSCNCAFYTMGLNLGDDAIIEMARRFGLGESLIPNCDELFESSGNVPRANETVFIDSVNLSIGQGSLLITPLQAANMVCIVANDGVAKSVNLAEAVISHDGRLISVLRQKEEKQVISKKSAQKIKAAMEGAADYGTAKALSAMPFGVSGKTGTAETGWIEDGKELVHGWFCGYFPKDKPRYAVAVLAENGGSGAESALPVFEAIAKQITEIYPWGENEHKKAP